jgi:hypothetical protein
MVLHSLLKQFGKQLRDTVMEPLSRNQANRFTLSAWTLSSTVPYRKGNSGVQSQCGHCPGLISLLTINPGGSDAGQLRKSTGRSGSYRIVLKRVSSVDTLQYWMSIEVTISPSVNSPEQKPTFQ